MTSLLATAPNESLLGQAACGLRLRLADHQGRSRIIEVDDARCTIGTAATCTVCLPEKPSLRRRHSVECVILRGRAQTVIRRLSSEVRLNGREFTDAVLHAGDRLAIGAYEIEVLAAEEGGTGLRPTAEPFGSLLAAERSAWQLDRDRLLAEIAAAKAECERLAAEAETHLARQQQTQSATERLKTELAQTWAALEEDRRQWQVERQQQYADLSQKTAALTAAMQQSSRLEAALAAANERALRQAAEAKAAAARYEETQRALDELQSKLAKQVARFDADRSAWQQQRDMRSAESNQMSLTVAAAVEASSRLQDELDCATQQIAQLTANENSWAVRQARAADDLAQANDRITRLEDELAAQRADRQSLQDALSAAENRSTELNEKAAESADAADKVFRLEAELSRANERLEQHALELNAAAEENARLRGAAFEAQEQILQLNRSLEQAATDRDQAQSAFDQQSAAWGAQHEVQETELNRTSGDLAAAIDQLSHLSLAFAEANAQVQRLSVDVDRQRDLARESHEALQYAREELAQVRAAYERQGEDELRQARAAKEASGEIEELRNELETVRALLARERAAWEDERRLHQLDHDAGEAEAKTRYAIMSQRLAELTSELNATQQRLTEEREQWRQSLSDQQTESDRRIAELKAEAAAALADAPAAPAVPEEPCGRPPEQADMVECEIAAAEPRRSEEQDASMPEYGEAPEATEPAVEEPIEAHVTQTDDLLTRFAAKEQEQEPELAFQAPSAEAPVTTADLLSRFGLSIQHDASESPSAEPQAAPGHTAPPPPAPAPMLHAAAEAHHDEQDSIDAYMAQLMARLGRSTYTPPREKTPQPAAVAPEMPRMEAAKPAVTEPAAPKLREPKEMGRRALPPELSADLSAMREIANLNARAAIDTHVRRSLIEAWLSKAAVMVLGLGAAGAETWFAIEGNDMASYFIVPCSMVAVFWGWQYLAMSKRLNQARDEVVEGESKEEAAEAVEVMSDE